MELFDVLKAEMQQRGWNLSRLAEACDVAPSLVTKWVAENPRYRVNPSSASCRKIAAALDLDPDYVLMLAGHRESAGGPAAVVDAEPVDAGLRHLTATWSRLDDWRKTAILALAVPSATNGHHPGHTQTEAPRTGGFVRTNSGHPARYISQDGWYVTQTGQFRPARQADPVAA